MTDTPLMAAQAALDPEDDASRLRFFGQLAESELVVLLDAEPEGDTVAPRLFELAEGRFVAVFDSEAALAAYAEGAAPYAALPGHVLAGMLAGQGIGLAVNPQAEAAQLLPPEAVDWLAATLAEGPAEATARPEALHPPADLPAPLLAALDAALARAEGLASAAFLARLVHSGGADGHLLVFLDAAEGARPALARAVGRALTFSGQEGTALDVGFAASGDTLAQRLERVALRFDLAPARPSAPVSDPSRPPRLR